MGLGIPEWIEIDSEGASLFSFLCVFIKYCNQFSQLFCRMYILQRMRVHLLHPLILRLLVLRAPANFEAQSSVIEQTAPADPNS